MAAKMRDDGGTNDGDAKKARAQLHLTSGGRTKIDRYGWSDPGPRGELRWIAKDLIEVDEIYQRDLNEGKAVSIASNFSWAAFGVVTVADRRNGVFAAIDGQHRLGAAIRRADITEVPCVVFQISDLPKEAQAFLQTNTFRKPLTGLDRFRAAILVGHAPSMLVNELIVQTNRTPVVSISNRMSGRVVGCLSRLVVLAETNDAVLRRMFPVIDSIFGDAPITERVLCGLLWLESRMPEGESLTQPRWRKRLMDVGAATMEMESKRSAAAFSRGGDAVWARGCLIAINRGLRHRLVIEGVEL
jgi:hypothetical protein